MKLKKFIIGLSFFTSISTIIYWILVFFGLFSVKDIIPGFRDWFFSFPLADLWLAVCFALTGIFYILNKKCYAIFGIAAGSSIIFLALNALLYGFNTGLLFNLTVDEVIEIIIKIYSLTVGTFFIIYFGRKIKI